MSRALRAPGLTAQASRLLTHMADVVDAQLEFYEGRQLTCDTLGMHEDTVKTALRQIISKGYAEEAHAAIKGKRTRCIRLRPDRWPSPQTNTAQRGADRVRASLAAAAEAAQPSAAR